MATVLDDSAASVRRPLSNTSMITCHCTIAIHMPRKSYSFDAPWRIHPAPLVPMKEPPWQIRPSISPLRSYPVRFRFRSIFSHTRSDRSLSIILNLLNGSLHPPLQPLPSSQRRSRGRSGTIRTSTRRRDVHSSSSCRRCRVILFDRLTDSALGSSIILDISVSLLGLAITPTLDLPLLLLGLVVCPCWDE